MASFSIPLSGLNSSTEDMNVIANNLANLNTVGYKTVAPEFATLFYQDLGNSGSGDPIQEGTGTTLNQENVDYTDGAVSSTGVDSNAALQGAGFFIVNQGGTQYYTRAGDFTVSSNGILQTAEGADVLGFQAQNGVINTNQALSPLEVGSNVTSPATATSQFQLALNLDSDSAVGATFTQSIQVFDSLGGSHTLTANFTKSATNTWSYTVTLPGADTGSANPTTTVGTGTLDFNSSGNVVPPTNTTPPSDNIALSTSALSNGAAGLDMTWQLFDSEGNDLITQNASASAAVSSSQNGNAAGDLQSFAINPDGSITGSFSNGQTQSLGQIALANFANVQGLVSVGQNNLAESASSGQAIIGVPGSGGLGSLDGGAIEQSNVDIATQFTNLIQAQQGYEANAHAVTTFDQVIQATLNIQSGA